MSGKWGQHVQDPIFACTPPQRQALPLRAPLDSSVRKFTRTLAPCSLPLALTLFPGDSENVPGTTHTHIPTSGQWWCWSPPPSHPHPSGFTSPSSHSGLRLFLGWEGGLSLGAPLSPAAVLLILMRALQLSASCGKVWARKLLVRLLESAEESSQGPGRLLSTHSPL
jgi:hypothetical protein